MNLKCIAVDDEPLALELVCTFIGRTPFLDLVGRYSNAIEALNALKEQEIELIFLDIQMPDLSGIELARVIDRSKNGAFPRIVFTTAFNQFALDGFKVEALDYLIKPFNYEEFLVAASRAHTFAELVRSAEASVEERPDEEDKFLFLKVEYQMIKVALEDILYFEGLKDYVKVHLKSSSKAILTLSSLKIFEERLSGKGFLRVHRSFIISLDNIKSITRNTIQIGDISITVGDQYKEDFNKFITKWI